MTIRRMTVAQATIHFLAAQYSQRDGIRQRLIPGAFGIFGHGNVTGLGQALEEIGASLRDNGTDFPFIRAQNEQAMVHSAVAFAKMKNRLQTWVCTSSVGPGATNMITGAALATVNRLPVLLLPGDTFANRIPHPVLQQLEHPSSQDMSVNDCFRPVSRYFDRINRPEQLLSSLPEAMRVLTDPAETGAVTIAMPEDVQTEAFDFPESFFAPRIWNVRRTAPTDDDSSMALEMIARARKPLIIAGGGAIYADASESLATFASRYSIPVAETQAGKGVLPWNHPWNLGPVGANGGSAANAWAKDADLVIALGTRLADFTTASKTAFQNPHVQFIGINANAADAVKLGAYAIIADAKATLDNWNLSDMPPETRSTDIASLKAVWDGQVDKLRTPIEGRPVTQANIIGAVNDVAGPRDVVVCAAGGMPADLLKLWRPEDPKGYHVEYGYSCMGYEIAGALGVKMADPDREIYVMVGDGSYLMLHTEIVTSIQEGLKLTIILVDNGGFQCIRGLQMESGSPSFGNELRYRNVASDRLDGEFVPVDFVRNAESLGAVAISTDTIAKFLQALEHAKSLDRTVLIYIRADSETRVPGFGGWWDVPIAEVSSETGVNEAKRAYDETRQHQRYLPAGR
ncbi:MAG: 3D-(3,5/4)-trihydroxycyclohexane-1,2-dione acylhydrolase (decyclizing), partial [Thermomicrobiales bacterium]